ncbi:MAG: SsrA-binding protein SmpB [Saprospiraceae bacterium]|jgi:SsrA-binding protein
MTKHKYIKNINIKNKKAKFEYFFDAVLEAGIQLTGTEIKSIRLGKASLTEAYCRFKGDELFIYGMHISEYTEGTYNNHDPIRVRKLLLHKRELKKLQRRVVEKGVTIVPYRLYLSERGMAKVEIALATGKKSYDKRNVMKERDSKRQMDRIKKQYG